VHAATALKLAESQAEVQRGQEREALLIAEVTFSTEELKKSKARVVELEVCSDLASLPALGLVQQAMDGAELHAHVHQPDGLVLAAVCMRDMLKQVWAVADKLQLAVVKEEKVGRTGSMGALQPHHLHASSTATAVVLPQVQVLRLNTLLRSSFIPADSTCTQHADQCPMLRRRNRRPSCSS
jgi:hypothetical protein